MSNNENKLGSFLMKLSEDQQLHKEFVADPKATMIKHQLADEDIKTVLSKNSKAMSAALSSIIKRGGVGKVAPGTDPDPVVVVVTIIAITEELNG